MAESEEELKSLFMKVKEESENIGLKLKIQKTKIMASGLITSWEIDGETVETVADFILGGSKWQPTPVFLPGESHRLRSLIGCSPWGGKESDMTEQLHFTHLKSLKMMIVAMKIKRHFLGGKL